MRKERALSLTMRVLYLCVICSLDWNSISAGELRATEKIKAEVTVAFFLNFHLFIIIIVLFCYLWPKPAFRFSYQTEKGNIRLVCYLFLSLSLSRMLKTCFDSRADAILGRFWQHK